ITNYVTIVSSSSESQCEVKQTDDSIGDQVIDNVPKAFVVDTSDKIEKMVVTDNDPAHKIVANEAVTENITHDNQNTEIDQKLESEISIKNESFPNLVHDDSNIFKTKTVHESQTHEESLTTELSKIHEHSIPTPDLIDDPTTTSDSLVNNTNGEEPTTSDSLVNNTNGEEPYEKKIGNSYETIFKETNDETTAMHKISLIDSSQHEEKIATVDTKTIEEKNTVNEIIDKPIKTVEPTFQDKQGSTNDLVYTTNFEALDKTVKTFEQTFQDRQGSTNDLVDSTNFEAIDKTVKTFEQTFQDRQGSTNDLVDTTNLEAIDKTVKTFETTFQNKQRSINDLVDTNNREIEATLKDSIEKIGKHLESTSITDPSSMSPYNVCFSYKKDDINVICIDDNLRVKIERLSADIARVYFTDIQDIQVPIPATITFWDLSNNQALLSFNNNFIITWISNYAMYQ
ncbi:14058_t:CDS:1, partial [Racocetra fulgida]